MFFYRSLAGLKISAATRPFATKKSSLASEKILLVDSLATESCPLAIADRLATEHFSNRTTPMRTECDCKVCGSLCWSKMQIMRLANGACRSRLRRLITILLLACTILSLRTHHISYLDCFGNYPSSNRCDIKCLITCVTIIFALTFQRYAYTRIACRYGLK